MSILHAHTTHKRMHIQKFSHMYVYESGQKEIERERERERERGGEGENCDPFLS